jgi:hypothetical protein
MTTTTIPHNLLIALQYIFNLTGEDENGRNAKTNMGST